MRKTVQGYLECHENEHGESIVARREVFAGVGTTQEREEHWNLSEEDEGVKCPECGVVLTIENFEEI